MTNRWLAAQRAEAIDWASWGQNERFLNQEYWAWELGNFGLTVSEAFQGPVLEIGCGPFGMIHSISSGGTVKIGIDPLAQQYFAFPLGPRLRELCSIQGTNYVQAVGESLPFPTNSFGSVICFNVLDHVFCPGDVLRESHRVLRMGGRLLFNVNAIPRSMKPIRAIADVVDPPHPHHFTPGEVLDLLQSVGYDLTLCSVKKRNAYPHLLVFRSILRPSVWKHLVSQLVHLRVDIVAKKVDE